MLTVGSLFSGIGGLDLGLERAGMRVIWQSEIEPYCCKVLAKHWPNVPNLGDIKQVDWSRVERPDVICGGYPCQPFSLAGVRRGEDDPRHLWPHMLDAIRVLRPRFAILENVPGHRSLGFGRVLGDLAESGFDVEWESVPAAFVGAPHLRDRVFLIAHANSESEPSGPVHAAPQGQLVPDSDGFRFELLRVGLSEQSERGDVRSSVPDSYSDELREQPIGVGRCGGASLAGINGTHRSMAYTTHTDRRANRTETSATRPQRLNEPRGTSGRNEPRSDWWAVEPDVGGTLDGFSAWLDESGRLAQAHELILTYGDASGEPAAEVVSAVRQHLRTQDDEWPTRGRECLSSAEVLFAFLRQLETHSRQAGQPLAGSSAPQVSLRSVRLDEVASRPPLRRQPEQQRPGKPANSLHPLSRLLAQASESAWAAYRRSDACPPTHWESGVSRVADSVPFRVDRLRGLGNAVVPQVAQFIGEQLRAVLDVD